MDLKAVQPEAQPSVPGIQVARKLPGKFFPVNKIFKPLNLTIFK
jgi:hypothetical protein